jgi:hypothetical protein
MGIHEHVNRDCRFDGGRSATQKDLMRKFHRGSIPLVAILDKDGKPLHDQAGEVEESELASILERPLK